MKSDWPWFKYWKTYESVKAPSLLTRVVKFGILKNSHFPCGDGVLQSRGLRHDGRDQRSPKNNIRRNKKDQKNLIIKNIKIAKYFGHFHIKIFNFNFWLYTTKIMKRDDIVSSSSQMLEKSISSKLDVVEDESVGCVCHP